MNTDKIQKLDEAVVQASKKIKVLNALAWPSDAEEKFLKRWREGKPELPTVILTIPNVRTTFKP
jgi:hypothetical protein